MASGFQATTPHIPGRLVQQFLTSASMPIDLE
jgi:hypothetical protein